jgi:2-polyprenyl-3-methyl-5-hydroxy-6-metoxy-1,4-benzoquinol methylase
MRSMVEVENRLRFEQIGFWDGCLEADPHIQQKLILISNIIPKDVRTCLDVGCGDGSLTNGLPENIYRVGCDLV